MDEVKVLVAKIWSQEILAEAQCYRTLQLYKWPWITQQQWAVSQVHTWCSSVECPNIFNAFLFTNVKIHSSFWARVIGSAIKHVMGG